MATALPLDLDSAPAALPPVDAAYLRTLSPEDAAYLRSFIAFCEDEEAREPGAADREIAASRTYDHDMARELADIEAGRHPLQQPR